MNEETSTESKNLFWYRVKFIGLIGVFLSPFILGWLALYVFEIKPESGNYGTLVQPVQKISWPGMEDINGEIYQTGFGRKWTFLLVTHDQCAEACRSNLFYMRQIRTLLGRDAHRLQNVLISTAAIDDEMRKILGEYPDLLVIERFSDASLLDQFSIDDVKVGVTPKMYLVDPDQNYMMHYPADPDEHRVLEDLRKLMKLSKIG